MTRSQRGLILALGIILLPAMLAMASPPSDPQGYRMDDYRAPTPVSLPGAMVLSTKDARALWDNRQAVFVDVLPRPPRPAGLPASTLWRPKPRYDVPGSIWLPDTGYGALAPIMEDYLPAWAPEGLGRRSRPGACVLLPGQLLDVMECRKACSGARLYACGLVSGWDRRLGGGWTAAGSTPARTETTAAE